VIASIGWKCRSSLAWILSDREEGRRVEHVRAIHLAMARMIVAEESQQHWAEWKYSWQWLRQPLLSQQLFAIAGP
jgi:hypothetical protein